MGARTWRIKAHSSLETGGAAHPSCSSSRSSTNDTQKLLTTYGQRCFDSLRVVTTKGTVESKQSDTHIYGYGIAIIAAVREVSCLGGFEGPTLVLDTRQRL
ncbi:hypothetical protein XPA_006529 [Xanthoria parietina]